MPLIEIIKDLQAQGKNEQEIVKDLQDRGVTPREINDALAQVKVKQAVSQEPEWQEKEYRQNQPPIATQEISTQPQTMQPSVMYQEQTQPSGQYPEQYAQQPGEQYPEQEYEQETQPPQPGMAYEQQYPQEQYAQYPEYNYASYASQAVGAETINEIAEQVVSEKLKDIIKKINELTEFKTRSEAKIDNIDKRLERIETTIDQLQTAIIRRIGEYKQDVGNIKKELIGMQDSFSKVLNPLTENIRKLEKISGTKTRTAKTSKKK